MRKLKEKKRKRLIKKQQERIIAIMQQNYKFKQ